MGKYPSKEPAVWTDELPPQDKRAGHIFLDTDTLAQHVKFILNNSYSTFADGFFKQTIGIPTGTNCAPELANLFLLYYEMEYFQVKLAQWKTLSTSMKSILISYRRYIDDIWFLRANAKDDFDFLFGESRLGTGIFPTQITNEAGAIIDKPLELEGERGRSCNFLDITTEIKSNAKQKARKVTDKSSHTRQRHREPRRSWLRYKGYNKQDYIIADGHALSEMPKFPLIDSKLNSRSKYGVVTSELVRYSRCNDTKTAFIAQALKLIKKMVAHNYNKAKIMKKVATFKHWQKELGKWKGVKAKLMKEFGEWHDTWKRRQMES